MIILEGEMVLHDLMPTLRNLTRADKLQVIQALLSELAKEEGIQLVSGAEYPVWSPVNATEAGETLLKMLEGHASR